MLNLREERIQQLTDLIAANMPPRKIEVDPQQCRPPPAKPFPEIEQTERARALRRISEIIHSRQWHSEIVRTLDRHKASYVDDLPDDAIFTLRDRMEYYEECVQCACDPDDAPPAR